jgi:hypothetical protein
MVSQMQAVRRCQNARTLAGKIVRLLRTAASTSKVESFFPRKINRMVTKGMIPQNIPRANSILSQNCRKRFCSSISPVTASRCNYIQRPVGCGPFPTCLEKMSADRPQEQHTIAYRNRPWPPRSKGIEVAKPAHVLASVTGIVRSACRCPDRRSRRRLAHSSAYRKICDSDLSHPSTGHGVETVN